MIKLALLTTTALIIAGPAWATYDHPPPPPTPPTQTQGQHQGQGQAQGQGQQQRATASSNATGGSQSQGQSTTVNNSNSGGGYGNGYNFPAATATAPSFGIYDKCQFALSGGVQVLIFGASGGGGGTYEFCKAMMKANYFREQGRPDMAKSLECKYGEFRAAYKETGTPCREDQPAAQAAAAPAQQVVLNAGGLQCVNAAGQSVPLGQPGAVRCR